MHSQPVMYARVSSARTTTMATIKTLSIPCRSVTSFDIEEHDPSELMRRVRDHLASTCEITKDTPFAVKALSGDVVMKCRIYRDDDGLFFDCRRYRGDALHFVDMWRRLCESESLGARARG